MMASLLLCLLPALLATASAQEEYITCEQCSASANTCTAGGTTCRVPKATGGCITIIDEDTLQGTPTTSFFRGCVTDFDRILSGPITYSAGGNRNLRINTVGCRDTDRCNAGSLAVPTVDAQPNGLQCPTCLIFGINTCDGQITHCRGNETYCIDLSGLTCAGTLTSFAAKGCASASAQYVKVGGILFSAGKIFLLDKAKATPAEKIRSSPAWK
ncbi:phospholipase A2 inhibitor and Ly6/PLAUR domain-containing protein-like [Carettochelys insculpta]|uniref:phospholipase A2 inhibitor and Ly6/PLAUR domain-containing protein-like n=1 Tax=Carettochelys insculpta TaxID=44489 RepID=UPI003EB8A332